jgi:hypothetical protein
MWEDIYILSSVVKCLGFMKDTEAITVCERYEELHEISGIVLTIQDDISNVIKKRTQWTSLSSLSGK